MMGNNWSIPQQSGRLWKSEKLQKYLSARSLSSPLNSSGICFIPRVSPLISWQTLQYIASISARVFKLIMPCAKRSRLSSRICSASCQSSSMVFGVRLHHISYKSLTNLWSVGFASNSSGITGNDAAPSTSSTRTEWWAARERPLSVMILGWGIPFRLATSVKE